MQSIVPEKKSFLLPETFQEEVEALLDEVKAEWLRLERRLNDTQRTLERFDTRLIDPETLDNDPAILYSGSEHRITQGRAGRRYWAIGWPVLKIRLGRELQRISLMTNEVNQLERRPLVESLSGFRRIAIDMDSMSYRFEIYAGHINVIKRQDQLRLKELAGGRCNRNLTLDAPCHDDIRLYKTPDGFYLRVRLMSKIQDYTINDMIQNSIEEHWSRKDFLTHVAIDDDAMDDKSSHRLVIQTTHEPFPYAVRDEGMYLPKRFLYVHPAHEFGHLLGADDTYRFAYSAKRDCYLTISADGLMGRCNEEKMGEHFAQAIKALMQHCYWGELPDPLRTYA